MRHFNKQQKADLILRIEEKYLNVGHVMNDYQLMLATKQMNSEYQRIVYGRGERPSDEFGLHMTDFEIELKRIENELDKKGYHQENPWDKKLFDNETITRLLIWAKRKYQT